MSVSALSEISQNPNAQPADRALATQALVSHLHRLDGIREKRAKKIHTSFKIICFGGAADWLFNDGKITKRIINSSKAFIQEAGTKLLNK